MIFKNFRFQIVFRVLLISANLYIFFHLLFQTSLFATTVIVGIVFIYQITTLIRYVELTNRNLTRFLNAIRYSDFSQSFSTHGLGSSFKELNTAFTQVMKDFQQVRGEKEQHFLYLQTVVEHVGIGLIAFEPNGDVEMMNHSCKKLLKSHKVKNIVSLSTKNPGLVETLFKLKAGDKALVKYVDGDDILQLMVYATEFRLKDRLIKLVSLQNIQSELEEQEMEAWQKLIRVLTHEIMNSVTPIASLSGTINELLEECDNPEMVGENIDDVRSAAKTIQKRSEGLLHFVQAYRSLTRLPKPDFQIQPLENIFNEIANLMQPQMDNAGIYFEWTINPQSLEITADPKLIEQVLINLVKNAMEAVSETKNAQIEMNGFLDERGRVTINISDNGPGITAEAQEKIFIPFFTTKKGGSGIGLSLTRQIMRLHRGTIYVRSQPNEATVFTLKF